MGNIVIAGPSLYYIGWDCRRCGHAGGMAKTTAPIRMDIRDIRVVMEKTLRDKLVRTHKQKHGCDAIPEDFILTRLTPHGDKAA